MKARKFWEEIGKNIRGLTDRKLRNAMKKHDVMDEYSEIIWILGNVTYKDCQEFVRQVAS